MRASQALAAIRADSPRPAPLSPEAKAARKPPPPEALVGALQERVHVERGRLVASQPLRAAEEKPLLNCDGGGRIWIGAPSEEGTRHYRPCPGCAACRTVRAGDNPVIAGILQSTPEDERVVKELADIDRAGEAECTCEPHRNYDDQFCPKHGKAREGSGT